MSMIGLCILIIYGGIFVCATVFSAGVDFAWLQRRYPLRAVMDRESDRNVSILCGMLVGIFGPFTLIMIYFSYKFKYYGWVWPYSTTHKVIDWK